MQHGAVGQSTQESRNQNASSLLRGEDKNFIHAVLVMVAVPRAQENQAQKNPIHNGALEPLFPNKVVLSRKHIDMLYYSRDCGNVFP